MRSLFIIIIFYNFLNNSFGQSDLKNKLYGKWISTKSFHKIPFRELYFKNDSICEETTNISIGAITGILKYSLSDSNRIIIDGVKSELLFKGNNKLKFILVDTASTKDFMYKLKFKRKNTL